MSILPSLDAIQARADAATEGPWAAWLDQDGAKHMQGRLMVGNADAVIPDGETWIEGVDVNPVAECYTPEDRTFIAAARTDVPVLVAALRAVLAIHQDGGPSQGYTRDGYRTIDHCCTECGSFGEYGEPWPCPTVRAVTAHIDTTPKEN